MATKVNIKAGIESKFHDTSIGEKSLKSLRSYQLGVVYKDKYGRETPVFTNENASFAIDKRLSDQRNSIIASMRNDAPSWADSYKFFIKETSNEYYNACMDRWYDAEDDNIWLSFPSSERNKIQEDTFIILKKKADEAAAVHEEGRYKVIDIQNEAPDFIKTDYELYGEDTLKVMTNGALPGSKTIKFEFDGSAATDWKDESVFYDPGLVGEDTTAGDRVGVTDTGFIGWPLEDIVINLSQPGARTGWLDVANIYKETDIFISLSKPLEGEVVTGEENTGAISSILPTGAGDVTVKLAKKVVKNKPEFNGHFFVKVRRDNIINTYIRSVGNPIPNFRVDQSQSVYSIDAIQYPDVKHDDFWGGVGEKFFIDNVRRRSVGTGGAQGTDGPWLEDDGYGIDGNRPVPHGNFSTGPYTMDLSLNKIPDTSKGGFSTANLTSSKKDFINKMSSSGTIFRWKEDPFQHIYVIEQARYTGNDSSLNGNGIYNYSSKGSTTDEKANKAHRIYIKFKNTGYRLDQEQALGGTYGNPIENEIGLYPFKYGKANRHSLWYGDGTNNQPSVPIVAPTSGSVMQNPSAWDPTKRGYGVYASSGSAANDGVSPNAQDWTSLTQASTTTNSFIASRMYNTIEILDSETGDVEPVFTKDPAIWETEPREDKGLDIYYEASQAYPVNLNNKTNELFAPYGCEVTCDDVNSNNRSIYIPSGTVLYDWAPTGHGGDAILLNIKTDEIGIIDNDSALTYDTSGGPNDGSLAPLMGGTTNPDLGDFGDLNTNLQGLELKFTRQDGSYTTAKVKYFSGWFQGTQVSPPTSPVTYTDPPQYFINGYTYTPSVGTNRKVLIKLDRDLSKMNIKLPYFNCYSFGNGVESDRIRDDFNAVRLDKGVKASTVLDEPYDEEQKTNGLIYSGLYNSTSGINNLNQFIAAETITKDVNPSYGSIQKLKTRDTNLVAFCEDKILKIVANKDALYNADGQPQLIASNKVLGNVTTFAGEFGISKNPESYAEDSFRMYCTDKQRGKVLRISGDGVTPISEVGMQDYFADNLKKNDVLLGSFDDRKQEYNLTLKKDVPRMESPDVTISFSETAKGWTSFKSFIQDSGLSLNNEYYTVKEGVLWKHHDEDVDRNTFYNDWTPSHVDVLFNEESETVKSFASMKYEGTQGKITENLGHTDANGVFYPDNEYYNNIGKPGWYVESGITDLQEAGEMEFKNKEGKWFSYMKGKPVAGANDLDSKEFSFQGIDLLESIVDNGGEGGGGGGTLVLGCTDPTALNYNPNATQDDNSCLYNPPPQAVPGCMDPLATNYDPIATQDDGSCVYPSAPTSFTITVQDIGDQDPVVGNI